MANIKNVEQLKDVLVKIKEFGVFKEPEIFITQINEVQEQRLKLNNMLTKNGVPDYFLAQEVIDSAEQNICNNIESAIMKIENADFSDIFSTNDAMNYLKNMADQNKKELEKSQNFLFSVADLLNQQGDNADYESVNAFLKNPVFE